MMERLLDLVASVCCYALRHHTIEFRPYYAVHPCDGDLYMVGPVFSWEPQFNADSDSATSDAIDADQPRALRPQVASGPVPIVDTEPSE